MKFWSLVYEKKKKIHGVQNEEFRLTDVSLDFIDFN